MFVLVSWLLVSTAAFATDATPTPQPVVSAAPLANDQETLAPVEIVGMKDAARVSYERLLDGAATFSKLHALAPAAELQFEVFDRAEQPRPPVVIRLEMPDRLVGLDLDASGRFVLPGRDSAGAGEGELLSNRKTGQLRIYPSVLTPGTTPEHRRLGDVRAECEVLWTVYRAEANFVLRNAVEMAGGICRHSSIAVGIPSARKIVSATLRNGERTEIVRISATGLHYLPPMHDTSWPDDARIDLIFE